MSKQTSSDQDCIECLELLHLMLDNESNLEQDDFLKKHFENCVSCFESYKLEKELKFLIKNRMPNKPLPVNLVTQIKEKLLHLSQD